MRVNAISDMTSPSRSPASCASSIGLEDLPITSETTESHLMLASSSSFWIGWVCRARP
jgi:hypothetical protein